MNTITFKLNGVEQSVSAEVSSTTSLLRYIREKGLTGTKYMCLEGGCGACIVSAVKRPGETPQAINSCLAAVTSCSGWEITTIEGLGNKKDGYHILQKTLADNNGTQCGYCSPGTIMNMYSFLQKGSRSSKEIERALGSNLCRCTGYRPIVQSFTKFATDAPNRLSMEIEDLSICGNSDSCCSKQQKGSDKCCSQKPLALNSEWCLVSKNDVQEDKMLHIKLKDNRDFYRASSLGDVFSIWDKHGLESYILMWGNTAKGVLPILQPPAVIVDMLSIKELRGYTMDQNLIINAGCTLGEMVDVFETVKANDGFHYLEEFKLHIDEVAHNSIRSMGSIGGNMMIKKHYPAFQSDIYLIAETVGAELTILEAGGIKRVVTLQAFLELDMTGKIILNMMFPPLSEDHKVRTYKIMPRCQSVHAMVNAGYMYQLDSANVVQKCIIVYGALSKNFTRAWKTERFLVGKNLFSNETLKSAMDMLNDELVITENLLDPPVAYRRKMALGLFYKGLLSICPPSLINQKYMSGGVKLRSTRKPATSNQEFETNPAMWPITKPLPKNDALIQCAGEAQYTDDMPLEPGELFLAFVLAKVPRGTIESMDASKAFEVEGVVPRFFTAKDIPGVNSFIPAPNGYNLANEELFCDGNVKYFDQPVGVIAATSLAVAEYAATLVKITYTNVVRPVIDINTARADSKRVSVFQAVPAKDKLTDVVKVIKGTNTIYGQYHFPMETLVCVVRIVEEGLRIYTASQWADLVHQATSRTLNTPQHNIEVHTRRLGGAYGLKIGRSNMVSVATALVAHLLKRPCRAATPLSFNMRAVGKRMPCSRDFEVGVDAKGVIQYANIDLYGDNGYVFNEPLLALGMDVYHNCYNKDVINYTAYNVFTDTASNTWCRSPGTLENIAMAELMIEKIAHEMNLDPLEVRIANLNESVRAEILGMLQKVKSNSRYEEKKLEVEKFNQENRWVKRGLRFCFLRWEPIGFMNLDVNLSVYADDGTVVITHGGVEMGQGINAKAIQICAYMLKIPVEKILIKPNDTVIAPNSSPSGGSIASQNVGIGVRRCCDTLLSRLAPIKSQLAAQTGQQPSWTEQVKAAYANQVDLQVHTYVHLGDMLHYNIDGMAVAEAEVDCLTGEFCLRAVHLMEDAGQCINPSLDIGQIEGAFVMGLGYWTCENLVYHPDTGECLTDRAWYYYLPQANDCPENFSIYLKERATGPEVAFGAKGTGEPATCLSVVVPCALMHAIKAARADSGLADTWVDIDGPYTLDKVCIAAGTNVADFKFN